ncbi:hypothetical protein BFJ72_g14992 [Fusarium proliferatum]|uniref:Uncharacterized protein n=1 Tax=Gibberella intermedia TaxID=948311 RepID=A0A420RV06_GIBIN|nr:hypothetical protein BFJ72_g14992 [Fusarium proliferatum]
MVSESNREPCQIPAPLRPLRSVPTPFFIRTRHAFQPPPAPSATSQVLSFGAGELGLVHYVDSSGWGECNILESGYHGWIPTNYCVLYEPEPMRPLLRTMTVFSDSACITNGKLQILQSGRRPVMEGISKVLVSLLHQYFQRVQTLVVQPGGTVKPARTSATELQKLAWGIIVKADMFMNFVLKIKSGSYHHDSAQLKARDDRIVGSDANVFDAPATLKPLQALPPCDTHEARAAVQFMLPNARPRSIQHSIQLAESDIDSPKSHTNELSLRGVHSSTTSRATGINSRPGPDRLVFARAEITHCSLAALVKNLIYCEDKAKSAQFESAFFLTWELCCTASELLSALVHQFDLSQFAQESDGNRIRFRVCHLVKCWLQDYWDPRTDERVLASINIFLRQQVHPFLPQVSPLLLDLVQKARLSSASKQLRPSTNDYTKCEHGQDDSASGPRIFPLDQDDDWSIANISPECLASQITVKQMTLFCAIRPQELLKGRWMVNKASDAPNIAALYHLTNNICNWVKESILTETDCKARSLITEKWILTANYMFQMGNFEGLVAITSGLDDSSIARLEGSWHQVSLLASEMLQSLKRLIDPSGNRKTLRTLSSALPKPHLPFLGAYLTELIITEGMFEEVKRTEVEDPAGPKNKLINWEKCVRLAFIIKLVVDSQKPFPIVPDDKLQEWIESRVSNRRCKTQDCLQRTYYDRSRLLEPAEKSPKHQRSFRSLFLTAVRSRSSIR